MRRLREQTHAGLVAFGQAIRAHRKQRGLHQRHVHEKTGVSVPYLSQIENGYPLRPDPHKLERLATFFGMNFWEFMWGWASTGTPERVTGVADQARPYDRRERDTIRELVDSIPEEIAAHVKEELSHQVRVAVRKIVLRLVRAKRNQKPKAITGRGRARVRTALVLLSLAIAWPAFGWNEPGGFRDLPWGSPESAFSARYPSANCMNASSEVLPERLCFVSITIGEVATKAQFGFRSNGLVMVKLQITPGDFSRLAEIFVERYGRPTDGWVEDLVTDGGVRVFNEILRWSGQASRITLMKYVNAIDLGNATIQTTSEEERSLGGLERLKKRGAKDL